jgi:hypothetical protein
MQEWAKFLQFHGARSCSPGPNGDGTFRSLPVELNRCREVATAFSPRENISAIFWSSSWGSMESNRLVDMGLISTAIRRWHLAFCHEAASRCRCGPGRRSTSVMLGHACETLAVMYLQRGPTIAENKSTTHRTVECIERSHQLLLARYRIYLDISYGKVYTPSNKCI